jgi:hypothetical protein
MSGLRLEAEVQGKVIEPREPGLREEWASHLISYSNESELTDREGATTRIGLIPAPRDPCRGARSARERLPPQHPSSASGPAGRCQIAAGGLPPDNQRSATTRHGHALSVNSRLSGPGGSSDALT